MNSFMNQTGDLINEQEPPLDPAMAPMDPAGGAPVDPAMAQPPAPVPEEPEKDLDIEKKNLAELAVGALLYSGDIDPGDKSILERSINSDTDVKTVIDVISRIITHDDAVETEPVNYNQTT